MELELQDKVVLVTGSSRGIGLGISKILAKEGCKLVLNGRNNEVLEKAVSRLPGSIGISADVTDPEKAVRLVGGVLDHFGRLDGLVCNVGSGRSVSPGEENLKEWKRIFALNMWSATNMVEAAADALEESQGVIVCVSSICGQAVVMGAPVTYTAAKAALNAYVRAISKPLGKRGIRINAIAPGNILFDGSIWAKRMEEDQVSVAEMLRRDVALERLGSPTDVANLATYLLSPASRFVTGSIWTIDGGQVNV